MSVQLRKERAENAQGTQCVFRGEQVRRVEIESAADRVEILPAENSEIQAELLDSKGRAEIGGRNLLAERDGQTLRIRVEHPLLPTFRPAGILRVHMPSPSGAKVQVSSASGAVDVRGIRVEELHVSSASGEILAEDCQVQSELEVRTKSGRVRLLATEAGAAKIRTASGSMETKKFVCSALRTKTASGACQLRVHGTASVRCESASGAVELSGETRDLEMTSISGKLRAAVEDLEAAEVTTVSGRVDLELLEPLRCQAVRLGSTSGTIHVTLPQRVCPQPSFSSTSGKLHFEAEDFSGTGKTVSIRVRTVSGSASVRPS